MFTSDSNDGNGNNIRASEVDEDNRNDQFGPLNETSDNDSEANNEVNDDVGETTIYSSEISQPYDQSKNFSETTNHQEEESRWVSIFCHDEHEIIE